MNEKHKTCIDDLTMAYKLVAAKSAMDMQDKLRVIPKDQLASKKDEILAKELRYDALAEAEREAVGKTCEQSDIVFNGMVKMWASNARKEEILKERRDTLFSSPLDYYIEVIEENGFERILVIPFVSKWGYNEQMFVYWHPDGLLLRFDTFDTNRVNSSSVYYNWETTERDLQYGITSSYSCIEYRDQEGGDYYWCIEGNHDGREALIYNMNRLRKHGNFLKKWRKQPFLWLLHFGDTYNKNYDHDRIVSERLILLPQHVQEAIKGSETCSGNDQRMGLSRYT